MIQKDQEHRTSKGGVRKNEGEGGSEPQIRRIRK